MCVCVCVCVCITMYMYQSVSSVSQSCPTFCDPMDCSMPLFPVHHQLYIITNKNFSSSALFFLSKEMTQTSRAKCLTQMTGKFYHSVIRVKLLV